MATLPGPSLPYCGAPPDPAVLWSRWNLDPVLITALLVVALAYVLGAGRLTGRIGRAQAASFHVGWAATALALISPLCALSVSLFAARVGQHMFLAVVAAPLVAIGRPGAAFAALVGWRGRHRARPMAAAACFAAMIWFWHAPLPYAETFRSDAVYWAMHLTTFASAVWLWSALIDHPPEQMVPAALAALGSSVQMGLLGALITFAPHAFYTPHLTTTFAWGLTPLQDQQLGGAIMWIPGCFAYLLVTLFALRHLFVEPPAASRRTAP